MMLIPLNSSSRPDDPSMGGRPGARRGGFFWPGLLIGLLAMQLGMSSLVMWLALHDRTFAVEPNYYQRAVEWDQRSAARRAAAAQGWSLDVTTGPARSALGDRELLVQLSERDGRPLCDAVVRVSAFHHRTAKDRLALELTPITDNAGTYGTLAPLRRAGTWELRVTVEKERQIWTETLLIDVPASS